MKHLPVKKQNFMHGAAILTAGVIIMKVLGEGTINTPAGRKRSTIALTRMPYKDVMVFGFEAKQHID